MIQKLQRPSMFAPVGTKVAGNEMMGPCKETAQLLAELMTSATSMHQLHLKVSGLGAYAAHQALGGYYEGVVGLIDAVAEQYQGAREKILEFPSVPVVMCSSPEEALMHLNDLYKKTNDLQKIMPFSEVTNQLDEIKSLIASTKYKLLFLK